MAETSDGMAARLASTEALTTALKNWIRGHDWHVQAAVELLIGDDYWLTNQDFIRAAVHKNASEAWIVWSDARRFLEYGTKAGSSQNNMLAIAIDLGSDKYLLSRMDDRQSAIIIDAYIRALTGKQARP